MKEKTLKNRIRSGDLRQADVARRLAELAFGQANDCVRLVMEPGVDAAGLDLSLLAELKRSEKGALEIRLVDRLKALEMLAQLAGDKDQSLESFLAALRSDGEAEA